MRLPKYVLNKLEQGGYNPYPFQSVNDGFNIFSPIIRGISEAHANSQQQDYIQSNTANPLVNLAFDDGRSRDVKYGYEQFEDGGEIDWEMKKGGIHIKKENRGKFTEYKKRTGKTTEEALHSKDPKVRKMANFAKNARSWKKEDGGLIEFAEGGTKEGPAMQVHGTSSEEFDTIPSYLYYAKAIKDNNQAGAELALNHINQVRGPQTVTDLRFMAKDMEHASLNDIAKRNVTTHANPQMKALYKMVNENPDILDHFGYSLPDQQKPVAKFARGGNVLPPVEVVGHKNKETAKFYDEVKKYDFPTYQALTEMGQRYGFMKVNREGSFIKRSHYNPLTNTASFKHDVSGPDLTDQDKKEINLESDIDTYITELPHKIQFDKAPVDSTVKWLKGLVNPKGYNNNYREKGTLENEAHRVIGPALINEFESRKQDVINKDDVGDLSISEYNKQTAAQRYNSQFKQKGGAAYRNHILSYLYSDDDEGGSDTPQAVSDVSAPSEAEVQAAAPQMDNQDDLINSILSMRDETPVNPYKQARGVFADVSKASSPSGFRQYATPEEGRAALVNQLRLYQTGQTKNPVSPNSSIYDAMSVYAPASDGNNPKHYAEFVASQLGVSPNTPIRGIDLNKWADAVTKMEGNTKGNNPGNIRR